MNLRNPNTVVLENTIEILSSSVGRNADDGCRAGLTLEAVQQR